VSKQNVSKQGVQTKQLITGCPNKTAQYRVSKQNMHNGFNLKKTKETRGENFRMVDVGIND